MQLVVYGGQLMNFYCGFFLTWKTCTVLNNKRSQAENDTLLIKWFLQILFRFLLYVFIQVEGMLLLFLELVPLGYVVPFVFKAYVIMPHSHWHQKIYNLFDQLEVDQQTNKFLKYIQLYTRKIIVRALTIIESFVDMVRQEDLDVVSDKLDAIKQKIQDKKQMVNIRKSFLIAKQQNHQITKSDETLTTNAMAMDNGLFKSYTIEFNKNTCVVVFSISGDIKHYRKLFSINCPNNVNKTLEMEYIDAPDDNLGQIKLIRQEDTQTWLQPTLEALIAKSLEQQQ